MTNVNQGKWQTYDLFGQEKDSMNVAMAVTEPGIKGYKLRDLSGYTFKATIRTGIDGNSPAAMSNFSVAPDRINGVVRAKLDKNHLLDANTYYYEIDQEKDGMSETILEGKLTINRSQFDA